MLITTGRKIETCCFDQDDRCFVVADIAGPGKRSASRLVGYAGWAPWKDVLIHLQKTAPLFEEKNFFTVRDQAEKAVFRLKREIESSGSDYRGMIEQEVIDAIESLLRLLPSELSN